MSWINTDERKPENGAKVLAYWPACAYHDGCMQSVVFTTDEEGDTWRGVDDYVEDEPGWWMPLPALPKQ